MQRRHFLALQVGALSGMAMANSPVTSPIISPATKVQSLDDALRWLDQVDQAASVRSSTDWKMLAVFEHLAQSIEMSLDGFPQPKSALFQQTAGTLAFSFFKWRGQMSHGLTEPIPGAPALTQQDAWKPGALRLRAAIARFQAHTGPLQPHFAYGALSRADYGLAHTFHIANHQDAIVVA